MKILVINVTKEELEYLGKLAEPISIAADLLMKKEVKK